MSQHDDADVNDDNNDDDDDDEGDDKINGVSLTVVLIQQFLEIITFFPYFCIPIWLLSDNINALQCAERQCCLREWQGPHP